LTRRGSGVKIPPMSNFVRLSMMAVMSGPAFAAVACGGGGDSCTNAAGDPCVEIEPGESAQTEIQEAFIAAQAGDVIHLGEGRYTLTVDLAIDTDDVTIRGDGMDKTVLDFTGQVEGAQGILATGDNVVIEDLAVENPTGDAIKFEGSTGVTVRRVRTEWTNGPATTNGGYGIYPVQCTNVLIEESVARGASDTGIYVGQSNHIVVRRNRAYENVAGIEIENSQDADVYENETDLNTAGILIFNLPGLPVKDGRRIRVFDNDIHDNNEPNFAPEGNILGYVPVGTGFAVISTREVEFFDNIVTNNQTSGLAVVSYLLINLPYDDPQYDPYPETIFAHDNTFTNNGYEPAEELGFLLVQALSPVVGVPVVVPDMIIDGFENPEHLDGATMELLEQYRFCQQNNGDADFADLDAPNDFAGASLDATLQDCTHDALPPITWDGLTP
jgi:parallel beta-helix repeat protein